MLGVFGFSQGCLIQGSQCTTLLSMGETGLDQMDQFCSNLSIVLNCMNAAYATCSNDADRANLNSGKAGLEQQYNTYCSSGCSVVDLMKCLLANIAELSTLNATACRSLREMRTCLVDVRANCNQEDIKAQIDMQLQGADQMLAHCSKTK
ncbi:uncharacterized protein LOC106061780 isoform X2 [Biomphalaria glabrata]|uniref:Uncharacterized protein LOC106061780 isoform X2 n=1 Tax=Biomphalaria glabrata TaxID=6526 RepID=A0A9W3BJ33_BIOGL|nr:uncharacterized protein LOC106061780 isoform X2 [Biomphalaria glabrata]